MRSALRIFSAVRSLFIPRHQGMQERDTLLHAIYGPAPLHLPVSGITDYAIFMLDPDGRVAGWNPGAERMTGYLAEEIVGQHFSRFYPQDEVARGRPASDLQTAAAHGRCADEGRRLRKDGSEFPATVVITPMRDAYGGLRGYAEVTCDLTALREPEERPREREARLQAFLDHCPAAISVKDVDGRYLHVNADFRRRHGLADDRIVGRTDAELFPPEQATAYRAADRSVLACGAALEFEEAEQHADGPRISMVSRFPVCDAAGRIAGIGGIAVDITERRRAQEALRASERSFRELLDILPIAVYVCDSSGLIESHNRRAVELWGRELRHNGGGACMCETYRMYTPDGARMPYPDCPVGEVLRTGLAVTGREIVIERPDGSRRTAIVNVIPRRDEHGVMTGAINCLMDITERMRAERDLKSYAEQLRVLSRRLVEVHEESRLALSRELHDRVGQNLTALNINLGIVLGQLPKAVRAAVAPRLRDSQELVEATVDVITDVMADLRPPLLDDYGLLPALRAIAERFGQRTGIEVVVRGQAGLERLTRQAELSLCRIAQEALTNLAKHARADRVTLEVALPPGQITLTIADNGIGFEPGGHAQNGGRGGWGMLTMRERAVALGGTLTIDSAPGLGTRVTAALPRDEP